MAYTYLLVDPSAEIGPPKPFYVGCGSWSRPSNHFKRSDVAYLTNGLKSRIVHHLLREGFKPHDCIRFDQKHSGYMKAHCREALLIARYGTTKEIKSVPNGILTNQVVMNFQKRYMKRLEKMTPVMIQA